MGKRKTFTANQIINAIRKAEGNLSEASRILGCSRTTVHRYVNEYPTVADAYAEENDKAIDVAEGALMQAVKDGNITAIIFMLKTKGKHRGYVERQEIAGVKDEPIVITWPESSDE